MKHDRTPSITLLGRGTGGLACRVQHHQVCHLPMQCIVDGQNWRPDLDSLALQEMEACQNSAYKCQSRKMVFVHTQPGIGCRNSKQWAEQFTSFALTHIWRGKENTRARLVYYRTCCWKPQHLITCVEGLVC